MPNWLVDKKYFSHIIDIENNFHIKNIPKEASFGIPG